MFFSQFVELLARLDLLDIDPADFLDVAEYKGGDDADHLLTRDVGRSSKIMRFSNHNEVFIS